MIIIEKDGKYYRPKEVLEEIPEIEALKIRIKELEDKIAALESAPKITIYPSPICPCPREEPYNPIQPIYTTPWTPGPTFTCGKEMW